MKLLLLINLLLFGCGPNPYPSVDDNGNAIGNIVQLRLNGPISIKCWQGGKLITDEQTEEVFMDNRLNILYYTNKDGLNVATKLDCQLTSLYMIP